MMRAMPGCEFRSCLELASVYRLRKVSSVAIGGSFTLEGAQLHLILVGPRRLRLSGVQAGAQCGFARTCNLRLIFKGTDDFHRLVADLTIDIGDFALNRGRAWDGSAGR